MTLLLSVGAFSQIHAQNFQDSLTHSDRLKRVGDREGSLGIINRTIRQGQAQNDAELQALALYEKAAWYNFYMQYDTAIAHGRRALAFVEQEKLRDLEPKFLM